MKVQAVHVVAHSTYLPEQSQPSRHRFLWSYEVKVTNESDEIVQLLNRYWQIIAMTGQIEEVRGPGVVGLQPIIHPGKHFIYSSFCQLSVPQGTMEGHYEMQTLNEMRFTVGVPKFILTCPDSTSADFRGWLH